ncbi:MAG TPA: LysM domain-containing protein [Anaerolineaceae bacterium]|nr:LysM domain-containing protein [Anaerolineaceae bacterium]
MLRRLLFALGLVLLASCAPAKGLTLPAPSPTPTVEITPFHTLTTAPRPSAPVTPPAPTPIPTLTPTQLTYTVVKNDDMAGIALHFGISLQALKTANPKINPRIMSIGTVLIIPRPEGTEATAAASGQTPTLGAPTPVVGAAPATPACYLAADQSAWCFVLVQNTAGQGIENLSAQVLLVASGKMIAREAVAPLDLLPAGQAMPLIAHFQPPVAAPLGANATLTGAYFLPKDDTRYLPATVDTRETTISADALTARVRGTLKLPGSGPAAQTLWVLGVAYDSTGQVVAFRKWSADQALQPGEGLPFEMSIYSLGAAIAKVELLVEARP